MRRSTHSRCWRCIGRGVRRTLFASTPGCGSASSTSSGLTHRRRCAISIKYVSTDITFDRDYIKQLLGHVLPIAVALIGLSFYARASTLPVGGWELVGIVLLFFFGSIMRVLAVHQLGALGFKFDIVFREQQKLMTRKLYSLMRHPSYTAMMGVILAYALNTHSWVAGAAGMVCAWFGFQYRIHHEEKALHSQFGEDYLAYKSQTGMWFPFPSWARGSRS